MNTKLISSFSDKVKVDSWWRFLIHCSYCLCLCDATGPESDRYWSLLPQESDIENNKVVTGLRFVKRNRVIHLEIEQATARSEGYIGKVFYEFNKYLQIA